MRSAAGGTRRVASSSRTAGRVSDVGASSGVAGGGATGSRCSPRRAACAAAASDPADGKRSAGSFASARAMTPSNAAFDARRQRGGRRCVVQMGGDRGGVAVAGERDAAGQHPVQHAAEGVDVGAPVDRVVAQGLRGDEGERAEPGAGARGALGVEVLHEAEVGQRRLLLAAAAAEQDVRRRHVTVDQPGTVGGIERGADVGDDPDRAPGNEVILAAQHRAQVDAVDEAHHEVEDAVLLAGVVHVDDVRVVHGGGDLRLAHEPLAELRVVGELRGDDLHRDAPSERELRRLVDDAHPAARGQPFETAAAEDVTDAGSVSDAHRRQESGQERARRARDSKDRPRGPALLHLARCAGCARTRTAGRRARACGRCAARARASGRRRDRPARRSGGRRR